MSGSRTTILRGNLVELAVAFSRASRSPSAVTATVDLIMGLSARWAASATSAAARPRVSRSARGSPP